MTTYSQDVQIAKLDSILLNDFFKSIKEPYRVMCDIVLMTVFSNRLTKCHQVSAIFARFPK